jgi:hypothetical protein
VRVAAVAFVGVADEIPEVAAAADRTNRDVVLPQRPPALARAVAVDYLIKISTVASLDYIHVTHGEPHAQRGRRMLAAHPELRALAGTEPRSALWTLLLVAAQIGLALAVGNRSWMIWGPPFVGATIDHALWALIHDTCHNLIFRWRTANRWVAILANLPLVVPGAISFGKYHLLHHRHMGDLDFDAGIPGPTEARVIGRSGIKKATWIAGTIFVQGVVRPSRMKKVTLLDGWTIVNIVVQVASMALLSDRGVLRRPLPRDVDGLRDRTASARRPLDSGTLRARARPGDVFLLRSAEQSVVQRGLPQRASRHRHHPVVAVAADPPHRAGILRRPALVCVVDVVASAFRTRSQHHAVQRDCQTGTRRRFHDGASEPSEQCQS